MSIVKKMEELDARIKVLQEEYRLLGEKMSEEKVGVWEPKGGMFCIFSNGDVFGDMTEDDYRLNGAERETRELAEKASAEMRVYKRVLAYRDEHDDGGDRSYYVRKVGEVYVMGKVSDTTGRMVGGVYMSGEVARELVRRLNIGEVVL